jgi:hypothetical protein
MADIRITRKGEEEGEALGAAPGGGLGGVARVSKDMTRMTNNITLSDHIGKFVAGEVSSQFKNEDLTDMLKGKNMVMVSVSWG